MIPVAEAASILAVSERRVRQMITAGIMPAEKVGGAWLIKPENIRVFKPQGRPFSPQMALDFAQFMEGSFPGGSADVKFRLRKYRNRLGDAFAKSQSDAVLLVSSWLNARADRVLFYCDNLAKLRADKRFTLGGVSDPRAGISSTGFLEGYFPAKDFDMARLDYWLTPPKARPNLVLHLTDLRITEPLPILFLVADLIQDGGARESRAGGELLRELGAGLDSTS